MSKADVVIRAVWGFFVLVVLCWFLFIMRGCSAEGNRYHLEKRKIEAELQIEERRILYDAIRGSKTDAD